MKIDFEQLSTKIEVRLQRHHDLYDEIKIKDTLWEHALCRSIQEYDSTLRPDWRCGSQQIGKDMVLSDGLRISCKSGSLQRDASKQNVVKISSSRLSRFSSNERSAPDTFELIKNYLSTSNTEDITMCLSTKGSAFNGRYEMMLFDKGFIDYNSVQWGVFGKCNNLIGTDANGARLTCTIKMGWQVWYYVPVSQAAYTRTFKID